MTEKKKPCPTCQGEKFIEGECQCSSEWRGSQIGDEFQECQCTPKLECPTCHGSGYVD
jgi:hypothetical protein